MKNSNQRQPLLCRLGFHRYAQDKTKYFRYVCVRPGCGLEYNIPLLGSIKKSTSKLNEIVAAAKKEIGMSHKNNLDSETSFGLPVCGPPHEMPQTANRSRPESVQQILNIMNGAIKVHNSIINIDRSAYPDIPEVAWNGILRDTIGLVSSISMMATFHESNLKKKDVS